MHTPQKIDEGGEQDIEKKDYRLPTDSQKKLNPMIKRINTEWDWMRVLRGERGAAEQDLVAVVSKTPDSFNQTQPQFFPLS
jgi:hypothetical protein